ncbi:OmpP1/FadL family transporter [Hyphococcus sp.]|uniref:OmpP1/FadL family transporter n=1 Tax=Hyphococcus sp. TaxID=2038636 RepID=UPI003CCBC31E
MNATFLKSAIFAGAMVSITSGTVHASAFVLNTQSAKALGSATAGAQASKATPGNAYFNPASIVGVKNIESSFSIIGVIADTSYKDASGRLFGAVPVTGDTAGENVVDDAVFPSGAASVKLNDYLYAGLTAYAPVGFSTSYSDTSIIRYHGTLSKVVSGSISPILGIDLGGGWSIAGGPRLQYLDIEIDGAIDAAGIESALLMTATPPGAQDVFFDLGGDDWALGYAVGLQGDLTDRIHFGFSFTSKVDHRARGQAQFDLDGSAAGQNLFATVGLFQDTGFSMDLSTPAIIQAGVVADVTPEIRLLASVVQTRWDSLGELAAEFDNPAQPTEVTTQNWSNAWSGAVGAEFDLSQNDTIRFGVMLEEDPVNANFSTARIPGASRVYLAAGYSRDLSDKASLHLSASYINNNDQQINHNPALPENLFRGSLQADGHFNILAVSVGLDWRF